MKRIIVIEIFTHFGKMVINKHNKEKNECLIVEKTGFKYLNERYFMTFVRGDMLAGIKSNVIKFAKFRIDRIS